jgi:hypothetical protein
MKHRVIILFITLGVLLPASGFSNLNDFLNWPHQHVYRTLEEFYTLYHQGLYDNTTNVMTRIRYLHWALRSPFNHPVDCLATINNPLEYEHYKNLMYTHLSFLLTKEYMNFAHRFDKEVLYWYDHHYKEVLLRGYQIAKECYINARYYWHRTKNFAKLCYQNRDMYLHGPQMAAIQDEVARIVEVNEKTEMNWDTINIHDRTAYLDYRYDHLIEARLASLQEKEEELRAGLNQ